MDMLTLLEENEQMEHMHEVSDLSTDEDSPTMNTVARCNLANGTSSHFFHTRSQVSNAKHGCWQRREICVFAALQLNTARFHQVFAASKDGCSNHGDERQKASSKSRIILAEPQNGVQNSWQNRSLL